MGAFPNALPIFQQPSFSRKVPSRKCPSTVSCTVPSGEGPIFSGFLVENPGLAIEVAIYRMGNRPGAKIPEKWERKWKMAPGPKWPKNGNQNGKMHPKMGFWPDFGHFFHFSGHFSAISGLGPSSIFCPIFPGFLLQASSYSVNGHFNRNQSLTKQPPQSSSKGSVFVRIRFGGVPSAVEEVVRVRFCCLLS